MSESPAMREARIQNLKMGLLVIALTLIAFLLIISSKSLAWLVPFSMGVALISFGSFYLRRASLVSHWIRAKGSVLDSSVGEIFVPGKYGGHMEYFPIVSFEYATTSGQFMSQRFAIIEKDYRHPHREMTAQLIQQYPQGASIEVYVSPSDPSIAVLRGGLSPQKQSHFMACIVGGALVTIASIMRALFSLTQ